MNVRALVEKKSWLSFAGKEENKRTASEFYTALLYCTNFELAVGGKMTTQLFLSVQCNA